MCPSSWWTTSNCSTVSSQTCFPTSSESVVYRTVCIEWIYEWMIEFITEILRHISINTVYSLIMKDSCAGFHYPNVTTLRLANGMTCPSICRLWRACTLLRGFNFSGIFLNHIVAWPSGNSPTKNHEDLPRVKQEAGGQKANLAYRRISSRLAISSPDKFLVYNIVTCKAHRSQQ